MDTIIQSIFLLILCTQLCYTSGQPTRTGFRQRLSEFDETLEKATHDQKVKFLETLLKNIHEKSKDANPRNSNESPENLDAMKQMNAYVDSGEPQVSRNRDQSFASNSKRQKELGGKWPVRSPLEDTLGHDNSDVLTPMFIGRANSGQEKQLRLPEEESDDSLNDDPEEEDCVEDEEESLPEPPKFTLQRRPASLGSIDDFPSEAIDLSSKVISINNDPNSDVFDSMDGRSGAISFGKKKRCQKKVKEGEEEKGFRGLQQGGKDTYLIIKMQ